MLRKLFRGFSEKLEQRVLQEQITVIKRLEKEIEQTQYIPDPTDKGSPLGEFGFRVKGPEPTRYGDWERKGRVSDF